MTETVLVPGQPDIEIVDKLRTINLRVWQVWPWATRIPLTREVQFQTVQINGHSLLPVDELVGRRGLEEEYLVLGRTEGWSELLVTPSPVPHPTGLTPAVPSPVLSEIESLSQTIGTADSVLHHVVTLAVVEDRLELGKVRGEAGSGNTPEQSCQVSVI